MTESTYPHGYKTKLAELADVKLSTVIQVLQGRNTSAWVMRCHARLWVAYQKQEVLTKRSMGKMRRECRAALADDRRVAWLVKIGKRGRV